MQHVITQVVQSLGYTGVFVLMYFFASELIMPFAGYAAWTGELTLPGVIIAGTLGSSLGSLVIYSIARLIKVDSMHDFVRKYGRWIGVSIRGFERSERWFDRHARTSVLSGKLIPGVRTATSVSAGYRHMPIGAFMLCTIVPTATWAAVLAAAGYLVTDRYESVQQIAQIVSYALLVVVLIACVVLIIRRHLSVK